MALPQNEIAVTKPEVWISDPDTPGSPLTKVTNLVCIRITKRVGITPSTCELKYLPGRDTVGPATLINGGSYKHKQRVIVCEPDKSRIWFKGWLSKRLDQHAQNSVIWSANGDTVLLRDIYVRGCFVQDNLLDGGTELKYSAALNTVFQPKGAYNCTGREIDGVVYPVFTPTATYGDAYLSPNADYSAPPATDGSHQPWTPRRVLQYLQLVMHSNDNMGFILGENPGAFGGLSEDYLLLTKGEINAMDGIDPAIDDKDPLDRIMQQLSLQGDTFIGALVKTLKIAGTHQLATLYSRTFTGGAPNNLTYLKMKPSAYVVQSDWEDISVQFEGTVDTAQGTVYDFSLQEDSTNSISRVYCEGEIRLVETELKYDPDGADADNTIVPAWSIAEQNAFLGCVLGNISSSPPTGFAMVPKVSGSTSYEAADFLVCDGTNGTKKIRATSTQALSMAQQSYPYVFRSFLVKNQSDLNTALGENSLENPRPILPTQLQFLTFQASALGDTRLRFSLPVRLAIRPTSEQPYYDVPKDTAIRVTTDRQGDVFIWLDGSGIAADNTVECIYGPTITKYVNVMNNLIKLRAFKLNCAMKRDDRTSGEASCALPSNISNEYEAAFYGSGIPHNYLDIPNSFRNYTQYNSSPASTTKYYGGIDGTTELAQPLNRPLPPGDETIHSEFAAGRELARLRRPVRNSSWIQKGITYGQLDAGDWLGRLYIYKNGSIVSENYEVDGFVSTVVFDFLNQLTKVGDVFGEGGNQF